MARHAAGVMLIWTKAERALYARQRPPGVLRYLYNTVNHWCAWVLLVGPLCWRPKMRNIQWELLRRLR